MATIDSCSRTQAIHLDQPSTMSTMWLSVARAWRRLVQRRAQAQRNRRDLEVLSQLDDHQLKDIGLMRCQIESLVADRPRQDAATRHAASAHRVCDARA